MEEILLSFDGNEKSARISFNLVKLAKIKDLADVDAVMRRSHGRGSKKNTQRRVHKRY